MRRVADFFLAKHLANRFREVVSGSKDGEPDWVKKIAEGDDEGLFGPESAVWLVHGNVATIVGGIRALLLQAAHPAPLNGVAEHSRYESDPLGRLAGTTRWLTLTTFASRSVIDQEANRVNQMHSKVRGTFIGKDGEIKNYSAQDQRYLLWVHCAFTDSFLKTYQTIGPWVKSEESYFLPENLANSYIKEWSESALGLGLKAAPKSLIELEDQLCDFRENDLALNPKSEEVIRFILNPPFSLIGKVFYKVLANAAIYTLDDRDRQLLQLKKTRRVNLIISRFALSLLSAVLGHKSPSEKIARARIDRIRNLNLMD